MDVPDHSGVKTPKFSDYIREKRIKCSSGPIAIGLSSPHLNLTHNKVDKCVYGTRKLSSARPQVPGNFVRECPGNWIIITQLVLSRALNKCGARSLLKHPIKELKAYLFCSYGLFVANM